MTRERPVSQHGNAEVNLPRPWHKLCVRGVPHGDQ